MYPFKTTIEPDSERIGDESVGVLLMPRYGGFTLNESLQLSSARLGGWQTAVATVGRLLARHRNIEPWEGFNLLVDALNGSTKADDLGEYLEAVLPQIRDIANRRRLFYSTLMLRRVAESWTESDTANERIISPKLVDKVYEFALGEERGWEEAKVSEFKPVANAQGFQKAIAVDDGPGWGDLFWELQRHWPGVSEFSYSHFADQPVWRLVQALEAGRRAEMDFFHAMEAPVSFLHSSFVRSKINPKKNPKPIKTEDFYLFKGKSKHAEQIPIEAANAFFECAKRNHLPSWIMNTAPVDELKQRHNDEPSYPDLHLFGEGIALFCATINDKSISCRMLAIDGCQPVSEVQNPATLEKYTVESPHTDWDVDIELVRVIKD